MKVLFEEEGKERNLILANNSSWMETYQNLDFANDPNFTKASPLVANLGTQRCSVKLLDKKHGNFFLNPKSQLLGICVGFSYKMIDSFLVVRGIQIRTFYQKARK